ncbi:BAR domain-containing protein [Hirsutella rhossiliensis]|uniref:BAR domain-containing protein n=1 Tax=Hirsutella rhossiliensis TaxID=111463 RepID=A0A9P8SJH9_9HYPO|nr:BAR domain-containing protein [Hirsutella rhossiliensis]KAH0963740.1 BAR domain-containing protein [Hirsutella rhossiliensis]
MTMAFTKKIDRARQWAGEKMGGEARTSQSDEFQTLEAEMGMRQAGMENLQKSASVYVKWASRRCDGYEDKNRSTPLALVGRSMSAHANELEANSEFGSCLSHVGRANERVADIHSSYVEDVSTSWLQHLERSVTMMKEYQAARKKLESRRLAYDASLAKMQKSKRDDFRVEDEMRVCKTKFDDSTEDVLRRMQDIKDAEVDNVSALNSLLDAELDFHERAAEELRRTRQSLAEVTLSAPASRDGLHVARARSRPALIERIPSSRRLASSQAMPPPPPPPQTTRPSMARASTFATRRASSNTAAARAPAFPRHTTDTALHGGRLDDGFSDDESSASESGSPGWGNRSISSTTSHDSLARVASAPAAKKGRPPPPPVNRANKPPPPPVPARRAHLGC